MQFAPTESAENAGGRVSAPPSASQQSPDQHDLSQVIRVVIRDQQGLAQEGLAVAAGCMLGHQRCRPPYIGWSDETVKAVREYLKKNYPEFVYPE